MDVIPKGVARAPVGADQRRPSQTDEDRVSIRSEKIREEASLGIITSMNLVEKIDSLNVNGVVTIFDYMTVVFELLNINDRDLSFAGIIMKCLR